MNLWPLVFVPLTFVIAISISWTQSRGAPWVPTSMSTVHKMLTMAEVGPNDFTFPGLQLVRQDNKAETYLYHPVPIK